jgi:hypothetical protein
MESAKRLVERMMAAEVGLGPTQTRRRSVVGRDLAVLNQGRRLALSIDAVGRAAGLIHARQSGWALEKSSRHWAWAGIYTLPCRNRSAVHPGRYRRFQFRQPRQKRIQRRFRYRYAGNCNDIVETQGAEHWRGIHMNARVKKFLNVLPAFEMSRTGSVGKGQFIHQDNPRFYRSAASD